MSAGPSPIECPSCHKKLAVPASAAGKTIRCTACRATMKIPELPTAAPTPPATPQAAKPKLQAAKPKPQAAAPPAPAADPFDFYADNPAPAAEDLPADEGPPYFNAIEPKAFSANRGYRVFVTKKELVGVWSGVGAGPDVVAVQFGLIGVLIRSLFSSKEKDAKARKRELEEKELDELRDDHKHNFATRLKDIESAEFVMPSFWFKINNTALPRTALLKIDSREWSGTLVLATNEDMKRAIELLEDALGDRLHVGVEWDKKGRRYRGA